nr:formylglycine-generating enzyme family protein [Pleurocapsa sp. MO_192.B19]
LSRQTGKKYRLPTEAEWEYACRAGTTTQYHFGQAITDKLANYGRNVGQTTSVGQFPPNAFGLYDMHGNVWEWCQDDWHNNYEGAPTNGSPWLSENSSNKLIRGGSWNDDPFCRSAIRNYTSRDARSSDLGFRVVCVVPRTT